MSDTTDPIRLQHNESRNRYEVLDGDEVAGFTVYRLPDDQHVDFVHTEVDDAHGGQGLASRLVAYALADVRDSGKRIIPHCPYVASWLERHEGFEAVTDWP